MITNFTGYRLCHGRSATSWRRLAMTLAVAAIPSLMWAGTWTHLTDENGLPDRQVQCVRHVDDAIWIGTMKGLTVFRDGAPRIVIEDVPVWDVVAAGENRVWVGTRSGITLLENDSIVDDAGITGYSVGKIRPTGDRGGFWAIGQIGDGSILLEYDLEDGWRELPEFYRRDVTDLYRGRDGTMWVSLESDGILAAHPQQPRDQWIHHLSGFYIASFFEDADDRVWLGTWGRGAFVFEDSDWQRHVGQESGAVIAIRQDADGHIWLATTSHGLWQHDGENWVNHLEAEGAINMIETTTDGRLLISGQTVTDLRAWNGDDWDTLFASKAMISTLAQGPDGKIWAGTIFAGVYVEP